VGGRSGVLESILQFRADYQGSFGDPSQLSGAGPTLRLQEARLQALSLLLDVDPVAVTSWLDDQVWHSSLTEQSLDVARGAAGITIPPRG
jgi:hypothetical protein